MHALDLAVSLPIFYLKNTCKKFRYKTGSGKILEVHFYYAIR